MRTVPPTYSLTVTAEFIAQHFLIGGDFGPENDLNSHSYRIEARYEGTHLDQHGFLLDIDEIRRMLDGLVARYRDRALNELAEFDGLNPSVENFARVVSDQLGVDTPNITALEVTVWEDGTAGAGYLRPLGDGLTD